MMVTGDNLADFFSYDHAEADDRRAMEHGADSPLARLAANERERRLLLEQTDGALWTTDAQLCLTAWYGASLATRSPSPAQIIGISLLEVFGSDEAEFRLVAAHRAALAGLAGTVALERQAGSYQVDVLPLCHAGGEII